MATWSLDSAPQWAKDSVATDRGWVDPKTGDILVSCSRLNNAVSFLDNFTKGVSQKEINRGGARKGAGRKTDVERAEIAKQKLEAGEKVTQSEAKAFEKIEGVAVDKKQTATVKKKTGSKKAVKSKVAVTSTKLTKEAASE